MNLQVIARIHTPFQDKFGIPRQSGLVQGCQSTIVFEEPYRVEEALRGIEQYSHLWLLFIFDRNHQTGWSPTVRPPRLCGNRRMGVFATRSPFRPNALGLSSVALERIEWESPQGPLLHVRGADLMDGTPVFDIKPYLPFTDSHPDAAAGFAGCCAGYGLEVTVPAELEQRIPEPHRSVVRELLAQDPRPSYHQDADRVYGFVYEGMEIRFRVEGDRAVVVAVDKNENK